MLDTIIPKIRGFLFNPGETFRNSRTDETRAVVSYFGVLLLFFAGLYAAFDFLLYFLLYVLSTATGSTQAMSAGNSAYMPLAMVFVIPLAAFVGIPILGSLIMLVFSLWTHLWVYLLGGRKGFSQTLHALLYSLTPNLLLGWIPIVGMFASLWTLVLMFFGIREFQELDDGRTIGVILLSVFLPMVILVILLILAIMAMASPGGSFQP
ncbi:MAG: Yip1 family protein [Methanoregula sp.]|jgi:hypothetical protein